MTPNSCDFYDSRTFATEKEQQIIDQLRVMSQMLEDSARKDALVRQARRQDLADLRLKKE